MAVTLNGNMAGLPLPIRDRINRRLENGRAGKPIAGGIAATQAGLQGGNICGAMPAGSNPVKPSQSRKFVLDHAAPGGMMRGTES
jgi:hypothetical protein